MNGPRRRVLRGVLRLAGAALAALAGWPVLRFLIGPPPDEAERRAELARGEVPMGEARRLLVGGRPAIVVHTPGGLVAFSAVCTHLGCVVRWRRARREFFCPCHGGRFALDGTVIGGPPRAPLAPLVVEDLGSKIVVRRA